MEKFKIYSKLSPVICRELGADQVLGSFHMKEEAVQVFKENIDNREFPGLHGIGVMMYSNGPSDYSRHIPRQPYSGETGTELYEMRPKYTTKEINAFRKKAIKRAEISRDKQRAGTSSASRQGQHRGASQPMVAASQPVRAGLPASKRTSHMVEGTQISSEGIRPGKTQSRHLSFQAQRATVL